jgi:hypothetical protein
MTRHLLDEVLDARAAREAAAALLDRAAGQAGERRDEDGET